MSQVGAQAGRVEQAARLFRVRRAREPSWGSGGPPELREEQAARLCRVRKAREPGWGSGGPPELRRGLVLFVDQVAFQQRSDGKGVAGKPTILVHMRIQRHRGHVVCEELKEPTRQCQIRQFT